MKKSFILLSLILSVLHTVQSQTYTGLLVNVDGVTLGDMANLSQSQFQFGTSRSMAMAGALSSLGADASTMATNPAGLGLYQKSEFTFTPLVTSQKSVNSATNYMDNNKTTFSIANTAFVTTIANSGARSGLLSFSMGVAYNRLADLNYNTSFFQSSTGSGSSIGQFFSNQLNNSGVSLSQLAGNNNPNWNDSNITTDMWGAVLGYKAGLADWDEEDGRWAPNWIGDDVDVGHFVTLQSVGSVGEYDISMGANVNNKFYIGATLGVVRLHQEISYNYSEDYIYSQDPTGDYELNYAHYNQTAILNGTGINFKLGVIYRPIPALKIAFAVHTPTAISIDRQYQAAAAGSVYVNTSTPESGINPDSNGNEYFEATSPLLEDYDNYGWSFNTPTKIIVGASYILGNRALVSVDYQRDWYSGIRMTSAPVGINTYDYDNQAQTYLSASNTLRVGAEFKVTPAVALRGGYGFTNSIVAGDDIVYSPASPTIESTNYFSAGLGFAVTESFSVDFAYMNHTTHYTDFQLYGIASGDVYSLDMKRHNFALTTTFRW